MPESQKQLKLHHPPGKTMVGTVTPVSKFSPETPKEFDGPNVGPVATPELLGTFCDEVKVGNGGVDGELKEPCPACGLPWGV